MPILTEKPVFITLHHDVTVRTLLNALNQSQISYDVIRCAHTVRTHTHYINQLIKITIHSTNKYKHSSQNEHFQLSRTDILGK